ncbi:putative cell division protein WhiA [Bienertia sinuspersici]
MWHGGMFKKMGSGLKYIGGQGRTFEVDSDELCWFYLVELAKKCGDYCTIDQIYYVKPDAETLEKGLTRVFSDDEVRMMIGDVLKTRSVQCFVVDGLNGSSLVPMLNNDMERVCKRRKKLSPRRNKSRVEKGGDQYFNSLEKQPKDSPTDIPSGLDGPSQDIVENPSGANIFQSLSQQHILTQPSINTEEEQCTPTTTQLQNQPSEQAEDPFNFDTLPNQTQTQSQIIQVSHPNPFEQWVNTLETPLSPFSAYETYADIAALNAELGEGEDAESNTDSSDPDYEESGDREEIVCSDWDTDDDEFRDSRKKIEAWNAKALCIARDLEKQVIQGTLSTQNITNDVDDNTEEDGGFISEYEDSGDELNSPTESDEDDIRSRKQRKRSFVVNSKTDFSTLKWTVGIRFPNRQEFKECVTRYAIAQGSYLTWVVSDQGRQQRLGVKCNPSCPFRLYCSWDNRKAALVVKSVEDNHTCYRNMEANRQLKSTWLAKQFLEVFKAKPHWPAKEIVETIRVAYRVLVKPGFAYKVKYYAHRQLHGSMKEHYSKLGRFLEALNKASPNSYFS